MKQAPNMVITTQLIQKENTKYKNSLIQIQIALCANMVITTKSTDTERKYKTSRLSNKIKNTNIKPGK